MAMRDMLQEGIDLYSSGDYTGALASFLSLPQDSDIDSLELAYYLGLCYSNLHRPDDAVVYLEQVVTSYSDDLQDVSQIEKERVLQCRYLLALSYVASGQDNLADYELNILQQYGYRLASVYASLAYLSWQKGNIDSCISFYEKALAEDADNTTALNGLAYVLAEESRDLSRALTMSKHALSLMPESPACMDTVGWVYFRMGLYSQARKFLGQAVAADGQNQVILRHFQEAESVDK